MWRQINECGKAHFDGDPLPVGCEEEAALAPTIKTPGEVSGGVGPVAVAISLTPVNGGVPEEILHENVQATRDNAVPESLWACFSTPMSMGLLKESYEVLDTVAPTQPVSALGCFDAAAVTAAVESGAAVAFLGERDIWPGVDRLVAIYEDGRAVAWNQRRAE